jgi:hypothetical protein
MLARLLHRLHIPVAGFALMVAAAAFAAFVGIASHEVKGKCSGQDPASGEFVASSGRTSDAFTAKQLTALQCMGMPAVVPTRPVPGIGDRAPDVAVTAHGMMYNVTWTGPDGRTASLMIDHSIGSKLDVATSNRDINLGGGVTGYLTDYGTAGNDGTALELAWRDPRTHMWYKINGLPVTEAIAFYHSLLPVDLEHAR